MQFVVQSEMKLSSVEYHIHLGAAASAVALHTLCSPCPWSVLEIQVPPLGAEWKHFGKGDAGFVEAAESWFRHRGADKGGLDGVALGWIWDSYHYFTSNLFLDLKFLHIFASDC